VYVCACVCARACVCAVSLALTSTIMCSSLRVSVATPVRLDDIMADNEAREVFKEVRCTHTLTHAHTHTGTHAILYCHAAFSLWLHVTLSLHALTPRCLSPHLVRPSSYLFHFSFLLSFRIPASHPPVPRAKLLCGESHVCDGCRAVQATPAGEAARW